MSTNNIPPPAPPVEPGFQFDPTSGLMLPEGVELASVGRRIGAYFLAIPLMIVTLGIGYLIWGIIAWTKGTTPALQVLGMRIYSPDQRQVAGFGRIALREIIGRLVESVLACVTSVISFFLFVTRPDRRTLHDLIAGTVVLYDPEKRLS